MLVTMFNVTIKFSIQFELCFYSLIPSVAVSYSRYLKADKLRFGEAVTVENPDLLEQSALATLCSSWHTGESICRLKSTMETCDASRVDEHERNSSTHLAWGSSPRWPRSWLAHINPARFWSSSFLHFCSLQYYRAEGTSPCRSSEEHSLERDNNNNKNVNWD